MENREQVISGLRITQALASDYIIIYYVNLETERFIEYSASDAFQGLGVETDGKDFFSVSQRNARRLIHPDDREKFLSTLNRDYLTRAVRDNQTVLITYRMSLEGAWKYVQLKAVRLAGADDNHMVIGVTSIDEAMKQRETMQKLQEEHLAYSRIFALSGDYLGIYTVDPDTGRYNIFSANRDYADLGFGRGGDDFFVSARVDSLKGVYRKDQAQFNALFTRENVMREVTERGFFSINYRMVIDGDPIFVCLKAAMVEEEGKPLLIVGVTNIDAQVRRERAYAAELSQARNQASIDALTGVKNKHAYVDVETRLNQQIRAGGDVRFAIVVFDLNGLKEINDTQGHQAGDLFLKQACETICDVFKHSPVFRIGGDEFAVISQGQDYDHILDLMGRMRENNAYNGAQGGAIIACGMARYHGEHSVSAVFDRADERMYENKKILKDDGMDQPR